MNDDLRMGSPADAVRLLVCCHGLVFPSLQTKPVRPVPQHAVPQHACESLAGGNLLQCHDDAIIWDRRSVRRNRADGPDVLPADVFGAAFSRDIEPSQEGGSVLYDIMVSCIKVYRAGATACTAALANEPCCAGGTCSPS